jgi:hypothetical protein
LNKSRVVLLLSLFLFAGSICYADTIVYSNLDAGGYYDCCVGYTIGLGITQGVQFTPSDTVTLTSIQIALTKSAGTGAGNPTVALYADNSGALGSELISWEIANSSLPIFGQQPSNVLTDLAAFGPAVTLTAGNLYWLIASNSADTNTPWNLASPAVAGLRYTNGSVSESTEAAFAVSGIQGFDNQVPEPTSLLLLVSGLGCISLAAWRRKK